MFSLAHLLSHRSPALGTHNSEMPKVLFCTTAKPTHFSRHQSAKECGVQSEDRGRVKWNSTTQNAWAENQHFRKVHCGGRKKLMKHRPSIHTHPHMLRKEETFAFSWESLQIKNKTTLHPHSGIEQDTVNE